MSGSEGGILYFTCEDENAGGRVLSKGSAGHLEDLDESKKKLEAILQGTDTDGVTDHDYSDVVKEGDMHPLSNIEDGTIIIIQDEDDEELPIFNPANDSTLKNTSFNRIKNLSELKKVTPRLKFRGSKVRGLTELRKINSQLHANRTSEETKQQLRKYCRTCAGLKLPLVDIFSDKGMQMRLDQQMKHLEEINQNDSLSTQMCMDCICDLKMSYKFFMQIKKAEFKLKSIHAALAEGSNSDVKPQNSIANPLDTWDDYPIEVKKENHDYATKKNKNHSASDQFGTYSQTTHSPVSRLNNVKLKEEPMSTSETECATDVFENVNEIPGNEDNESIEEFDPDDPSFHPDISDFAESNDEAEMLGSENSKRPHVTPKSVQSEVMNTAVYQYDTAQNAYVKYEAEETRENISNQINSMKIEAPDPDAADVKKQPNILKRKLSTSSSSKGNLGLEESSQLAESNRSNVTEKMLPTLNVDGSLSIESKGEDGIMYVTVKGSKPNELLLVKVKKMDKHVERNDEKTPASAVIDMKPVDRMLKKYEALKMKEKDLFSDIHRKPDIREQIIEEQIEEYKRRREIILGSNITSLSNATKAEDGNTRYHKRYAPRSTVETEMSKIKVSEVGNEAVPKIEEGSKNSTSSNMEGQESQESNVEKSEENSTQLADQKQKWEDVKSKRESLEKDLDDTCLEDNQNKLERILGEENKNLVDFQDYLKQRKIVINRLKDEDIISLYEDRSNAILRKALTEPIADSNAEDSICIEDYLDCDYCLESFPTQELLDDHEKIHDYKIMHYCEDCLTEFPTNKAKKGHNIACLKKLICSYCNLMLDSKGKKRQHEQKHCDNIYGQLCDCCGEKFKHQGTLDQHIKTQHMSWEKVFQCPKCPKKFAFKQKLSFHLKSVHTTMRAYLCEDCGADFKNPASLRHHRIRKHQPVGNKRECMVCHKMVPFYSLSKHMHTHKAYTIQCPHCDKMFKNSSTLKQHVRIHEDQREYRCDICGVGFNRRDGLRLHMRVHEKTDSRGLKECSCQVCGEKFPNHSMLVIHRNRVHKDGRQYTCHICNRSMISPRSLEWHMSHIHNESLPGEMKPDPDMPREKKRVTCYHCDKTFKTEMILRTHIKNTHVKKDPMKCEECDQIFTSEVRLRHHMMVAHNRLEGTLPCPHCPKRFVNQLRLKTHMISHSEERPYTCEICGFNLKTKIQLIKHHQNRHSDERPLQCRYCPWRCKQVSALVCHERTHTNERPYTCSVCLQRFKYLGDKNKHERRHESLGGSGFKRIISGRNTKQPKLQPDYTSCSEQDAEEFDQHVQVQYSTEDQYEEQGEDQMEDQFEEKYEGEEEMVKFDAQTMEGNYEQSYEQEYEETSREASEGAEIIMNMEDTTVYTEEVTADNLEATEIITDEIMTNQILQSGTVVHLQQQDDSGKFQVIPVMLSLPDLTDANAEVNLATASIMYNN